MATWVELYGKKSKPRILQIRDFINQSAYEAFAQWKVENFSIKNKGQFATHTFNSWFDKIGKSVGAHHRTRKLMQEQNG